MTSHSQTLYDPAHGLRAMTSTAADGSYTVTTNEFGRVVSVASFDSLSSQLSGNTYAYDPHGRQSQITDARNGATTLYFNNADQTTGTSQSAQVTTNFFDNMGRNIAVKLPDDTYVTNNFDATGMLTNTFGSRTYHVSYTYDTQGRMKTMKTWQNSAGGPATTTWNYDGYRGWLTNKTYDGAAAGPSYTYTAAGRLASRLWARGTNTTYSYNNAGELSGISYNDGATTNCTYFYNRLGRMFGIREGSDTVENDLYNSAGNLLGQAYLAGPQNGFAVTNGLDAFLRPTNIIIRSSHDIILQYSFSYDSAGRLLRVSDGTNSATYGYVANSPLVGQILFTNNGALRMTTTKQYDLLNRLTNISSASSSFTSAFAYAYNSANQRTRRTETDSAYWVYQYDSLGQVVSGKKYWTDGTPVAGQQFEYAFDDIGNRRSAREGGDQWGANLRSASYSANNLNQYTSRTVPGYFNDIGSAKSNAAVTLWSSDGSYAPTYRRGDYFRAELPITNSTSALWLTLTNLAVLQNGTNTDILTNEVGNAFVPATPESFTYDADGNLTSDGRWTNHWDAENRLISMESLTNTLTASKRKLLFTYDHHGRRIRKESYTWTPGWSLVSDTAFLYDGWNLIAEIDVNTTNLVRSYAWGLDLSGSTQGAGGVGGLLWLNDSTQAAHFASFDGNGNVSAMVRAADGTNSANYEYGLFGEVLRATTLLNPSDNPFRFSTKYQDDETDLLYYGYRYYSPSAGRWPSRDPVGEIGGANNYAFVRNDPINAADFLGLRDVHLYPANVIVNDSSYDIIIQGDYDEITLYTPGAGSAFAYPWSYTEESTILAGVPAGTQATVQERTKRRHVLKSSHNSAADWVAKLTRIVDADFIVGATVPLYTSPNLRLS